MKRNKEKQPKTFNEFVPATILSEFLGVSTRRIHQLVAEKVIPRESRSRYPLAESVQAFIKHISNQGRGSSLTDERTRLTQINIERKKMELEVYRGEFVNKADAIRELVDREREIKTAFLSLPKDSSSELIGKGAQEIEAILTKKTFEICRQLARGYKGLKIRQGEAPTNAPENKP